MNDYDRQDLIKQRAGLEPPAHEGDYWSDEDRARLKRLFDMGFGISEIALELQRGEPASVRMALTRARQCAYQLLTKEQTPSRS